MEDFPRILDVALYKTPNCPFRSYDESLVRFTRAIYQLTADGGRCSSTSTPSQCGFFDPNNLYSVPDEEKYTITHDGKSYIDGSIRSSFGLDLIELSLSPSLHGKSLRIIFENGSDPHHTYSVELWSQPENKDDVSNLLISKQIQLEGPVEIDELSLEQIQSLDLVITRMDTYENTSQPGQYTIQVIVE